MNQTESKISDYLSVQPKQEDIEYYYIYEEYEVDNDSTKPANNTVKEKQKRDNSFEYYVESMSSSREYRKNP